MKKKLLLILLALVCALTLVLGLTACGDDSKSGGTNGTYYLYENGKFDKSQYIKLDGEKWSDDDSTNGTYKLNGNNIVFYAEVFGSKEEMYSGTLSDGALKIKVFGETMTYYKEGSEPSGTTNGDDTGNEKPEEPKTEYFITYDANGGAFSDGELTLIQKAKEGTTLTAPASPSRTASAFSGWATDKNSKTLWKFASDTVTGDLTLYAVWEEQSAAIISADGATIDEKKLSVFMLVDKDTESVSLSNKIVCSSDSVWKLYYDKLGQTEIPTKIAAGSLGELSDGDNIFYIVVTSSNGSQVNVYELTVHRSYLVSISFYDNKDNLLKTDKTYTGYKYTVNYTPDIDGYTFNYWKNGGSKVAELTPYKEVNLKADCTVKTYTAKLNVNGGNELEKTEYTITYDKSFGFSTPTRTGYTFGGWYLGDIPITNTNGVSLKNWTYTSGKIFTAKWTANAYEVTLINSLPAGGSVTGEGAHDYDSNVTITASTNKGYTWLGWYDKDDTLVTSELSYKFKMGFAVTYTAKWMVWENLANLYFSSTPSSISITGVKDINIKEIIINKYVSSISEGAFSGCSNLESITLPFVGESVKTSTDKYQYPFGYIFGASSYTGGIATEQYYHGSSTNSETNSTYYIPSSLKSVTITGGNILYGAFYNCNVLDNITVGENVTRIEGGAFAGCSGLESIILDEHNTTYHMAGNCIIENSSKLLVAGFKHCTIPTDGSVTIIGQYAFALCTGLTSITIPDSVTRIGYAAFGSSGLTSITIPDSVTAIGSLAFGVCKGLTSVVIGNGTKTIGDYAFNGCDGLTDITIPDNVTEIGNGAFWQCDNLTSVTLGKRMTSIGKEAFAHCRELTNITFEGTKVQWNAINKGANWNNHTGNYTVHCTDGDI